MNIPQTLLALSALTTSLAWAQMPPDHGSMPMPQMPGHDMPMANPMTSGEIRKIDLAAGKATIKHGEIKNLDMPGMTMVFTVQDKALLAPFKTGDKVQFMVIQEQGQMVITDLQPAK